MQAANHKREGTYEVSKEDGGKERILEAGSSRTQISWTEGKTIIVTQTGRQNSQNSSKNDPGKDNELSIGDKFHSRIIIALKKEREMCEITISRQPCWQDDGVGIHTARPQDVLLTQS